MTDFVSIDDMIDARQQAQPGFKRAIGARAYHRGTPYDDDYWEFSEWGNINRLKEDAERDGVAYYYDPIAPPEGVPLSDDPATREGQLAQAAYFNTMRLGNDVDEAFDLGKEEDVSMMRRPRAEENQVGARRGPAIGTAMDIKGDLRYGALGNDHPEVRLKLAEDDNRRRAMAKMKELAAETNLTDGEDYGSREVDPDDEMDFEDEDDDLPTLKEVGPAHDIGQVPLKPQKKGSSKGPGKKRTPPSEMDKEKMADRATKFNDRHMFKSEGTDINSMIFANQFEKANPSAGVDAYAKRLQASEDVPDEEKTETEQEITEDEVKEADTPKGKEDVRVGTEEAAAREDKAKAIKELGKAKEDEERADEGPRPDIDSLIAGRQWVPPMDFDIIGEDAESLTVKDPKTGETFIIPKG